MSNSFFKKDECEKSESSVVNIQNKLVNKGIRRNVRMLPIAPSYKQYLNSIMSHQMSFKRRRRAWR